MSGRRSNRDRESSGLSGKIITWAVIGLAIYLAGRHPDQAAAVVHYIASAVANLASHGKKP